VVDLNLMLEPEVADPNIKISNPIYFNPCRHVTHKGTKTRTNLYLYHESCVLRIARLCLSAIGISLISQ